jgi:uncharacterized protein YuzE
MKIFCGKEIDALYIQLSEKQPEGVAELREGVNLDLSADEKILGIEILDASKRMDIKTIFSYVIVSEITEVRV